MAASPYPDWRRQCPASLEISALPRAAPVTRHRRKPHRQGRNIFTRSDWSRMHETGRQNGGFHFPCFAVVSGSQIIPVTAAPLQPSRASEDVERPRPPPRPMPNTGPYVIPRGRASGNGNLPQSCPDFSPIRPRLSHCRRDFAPIPPRLFPQPRRQGPERRGKKLKFVLFTAH